MKDKSGKTVVFLSGPYRAGTEAQVYKNIQIAREYAMKLWRMDYVVICPHLNSMFMGGIVEDSVFLAGDLEILKRCDCFFRLPGWQRSKGSLAEIKWATENGMPEVFIGE